MRIETKKISELNPAKYNPREISDESLKGLKASLQRFGCVEPIIWNEKTGNVVGGHQRLKVIDTEETEVVVVDLDEIEEKALNVALNNPEIQGKWNYEKLGILLPELKIEFPEYDNLKLDELELYLPENTSRNYQKIADDVPRSEGNSLQERRFVVARKSPYIVRRLNEEGRC